MLARPHPFTTLGLLLAVVSPVFLWLHFHLVGVVLLFIAYGFTLLEFKKYTSRFQFGMLLVTGTAMGLVLDEQADTLPWFTLALLLAGVATIVRQAYMHIFTYVNLLWVDTGIALLAAGSYVLAIYDRPFAWDLWLPPLLHLGAALGLTFSYVQDAAHIRKRTRLGYKVKPGTEAPAFELPDQEGAPVSLTDYRGKHPVLLIFVRGDWCPGCHMMLRTYERKRARFLEKGVHVLAIGPDDISVNKDMVQRIGVKFRMLSDDDQKVSGRYGVVYSNPVIEAGLDYAEGIPLPASFLVDVEGIVRYVSRPDRVGEFLDPELIFNVLDQLPKVAEPAWN